MEKTDWNSPLLSQLGRVRWSTPKSRLQTISGQTPRLTSSSNGIASTAATVGRIHPPDDRPWLDSNEPKPCWCKRDISGTECDVRCFVFLVQIQKRQSSGSMDDRPLMWAKEYVESLHQNSRAALLFGKNNVLVQPVSRLLFVCEHGANRTTDWV